MNLLEISICLWGNNTTLWNILIDYLLYWFVIIDSNEHLCKVQSTLRHSKATFYEHVLWKTEERINVFWKNENRSLKNNIRNLPRKSTLTILSPLHFNPWKFFTITTSAILDSSIRNVNNSVEVVCNKRTRKRTRYISCSDPSLRFSFIYYTKKVTQK